MLRLAVLLGLGQGRGEVQGDGHHQTQSPHSGHRDLTTTHIHPQCIVEKERIFKTVRLSLRPLILKIIKVEFFKEWDDPSSCV